MLINMNVYHIQEWLFKIAHGRFDIDLAESGIQFQDLSKFNISPSLPMDYSQDRGDEKLRQMIKEMYSTSDNEVVVTHGGQEALYIFYQSFLEEGDEVVTTVPGWQQSWEVPNHIGAKVHKIRCEPGQQFPLKHLLNVISNKTKVLVVNYPNNPMGVDLGADEWELIINVCREHDVYIVNDEEYVVNFEDSITNKYEQSVSISSLSKVFGLPSLRVGWAVSSKDVVERMVNYKRYVTVSNSYLCEHLAIQAIGNRKSNIERYNLYVKDGYGVLKEFVNKNSHILSLVEPANTPFAWVKVKSSVSSMSLAERMLEDQRLLVMPAEVFDGQQGLRLTYAREPDLLNKAFCRMQKVLDGF